MCLPQANIMFTIENSGVVHYVDIWFMGKNDGLAILSYHVSNTLHLHACCISIIAISLS